MKKYTFFFLPSFFTLILISAWKFPAWTPVFGIAFLVLSLALAVYAIFEQHRGAEAAREKISRDTLILVVTIILVAFFGGLAGLFANHYVGLRYGVTVGFVSALAAGFAACPELVEGSGIWSRRGSGRWLGRVVIPIKNPVQCERDFLLIRSSN